MVYVVWKDCQKMIGKAKGIYFLDMYGIRPITISHFEYTQSFLYWQERKQKMNNSIMNTFSSTRHPLSLLLFLSLKLALRNTSNFQRLRKQQTVIGNSGHINGYTEVTKTLESNNIQS